MSSTIHFGGSATSTAVSKAQLPALLGLIGAVGALMAAFISQYGFGWAPCPLCIWQRWPYAVGIAVAVLGMSRLGRPVGGVLFGATAFAFLVGAGLGVFHSGVEFGWWEGLASCAGPVVADGGNLLDALKSTPSVRCDDRISFFLGLSMANWNVLVSLGVAACFAAAAMRRARG